LRCCQSVTRDSKRSFCRPFPRTAGNRPDAWGVEINFGFQVVLTSIWRSNKAGWLSSWALIGLSVGLWGLYPDLIIVSGYEYILLKYPVPEASILIRISAEGVIRHQIRRICVYRYPTTAQKPYPDNPCSTPRAGPSPSYASSSPRREQPRARPGGSSSKPSPRGVPSGRPAAKNGRPVRPGRRRPSPCRWEPPRPRRPWPSRITGPRRNGPSGPRYWPQRQRPSSTALRAKSRYYRWIASCTRRAGNNSPRGASAGSSTPFVREQARARHPGAGHPRAPTGGYRLPEL